MNNATYTNNENFWNKDIFTPQPTLDSELVQQLGFIPGVKEIIMLRQVHALEHATVWVLSDQGHQVSTQTDNETLGGLSTDKGFYLYGEVNRQDLHRAVLTALDRIKNGEWNLAIHPRCGTNLSVAMMLTAGLALGTHFILPRGPIEQILGLGLAATTAMQLAPDLGSSVQQYVTTAIPFNLKLKEISSTTDFWGRQALFVGLQWQDS